MLSALKTAVKNYLRSSANDDVVYPTAEDVMKEFVPEELAKHLRAAPPISVICEVNDSSLLVLGMITDAADLIGVDLFNSRLFQYYQSAVNGEDLPEGMDEDDLVQMEQWTSATTLPESFRLKLVEFFTRVDDIGERIAGLSQYRFERLRTWSHGHV